MSHRSICLSHTGRSHGKRKPNILPLWLGLLAALLLLSPTAHAAGAGGGGLPWEQPLTTLSNSVTGPVAYAVSLLGIVGCGGILIFAGGQVNEFLRGVLFIVLVIALIIAAKNTLTAFGFAAGATVAQVQHVEGSFYVSATGHTS